MGFNQSISLQLHKWKKYMESNWKGGGIQLERRNAIRTLHKSRRVEETGKSDTCIILTCDLTSHHTSGPGFQHTTIELKSIQIYKKLSFKHTYLILSLISILFIQSDK